MRVREYLGNRLHFPRTKSGIGKPSQWVGRREKRYIFVLPHAYLWLVWTPFRGVTPVALSATLAGDVEDSEYFTDVRSSALKKLSIGMEGNAKVPALVADSVLFKKMPTFCQFMTHTTYDDGSPRAPGRVWFDQDGVGFTVTLFEPSAYAKMRCRAATIDDAWALVEVALKSENPPWEVDQYARDKAATKKKK